MKKTQETLVLLDTHAILHRAYHALPEFTSQNGEPTGALYGLSSMILRLATDLSPDYIVACYDLPEPTFRHKEYQAYKAHRPKADEALVAQIIRSRDVLSAFSIPFYEMAGFEADDLLGTIVDTLKQKKSVRIIIASGDMDTLQLVDADQVLVYTLRKGINDTILYNEKGVIERYGFPPYLLPDYKGLSGDKSDNIPGIAGIGEKSATTLISKFGNLESIYKKIKTDTKKFEQAGVRPRALELLRNGEEEAMFSKMLATIRRDAPIHFALPERLWRDSVEPQEVLKFFGSMEFRSLVPRLKSLLQIKNDPKQEPAEQVSEEEVRKTGIALWVLDSSNTNPSKDDILTFTKKNSFADARKYIFDELKKSGLLKVYNEMELPLYSIVREAESYGMLIDKKHLEDLSKQCHKQLVKKENEIFKLAGVEFNVSSPKQLGEILFDRLGLSVKGLKKTAGGARSTRESELLKLRGEHPIIEHILEHRELSKLLSTYIDPLPKMTGGDGRLHTSFSQTGTTTGRMSSSNPNLQNIPVKEGIGRDVRKAFIAPKQSTLLSFDYSQIEMRMLALLSSDENLHAIFREGKDAHTAVAARVFDVPEEDVTKDMRRHAKTINFGIMYGMGVNALKASLGGTRAEAEEFYNLYFTKYPKIREYFDTVKEKAFRDGYTETMFGRRRYFPELHSHIPYIKAQAERMAMNAPLQGSAADIVKLAMIEVAKVLAEKNFQNKVHLLLQVHDELLFEIEENCLTEVVPYIQSAMEGVVQASIPLSVNIEIGKNWGDMKKYEE